MGIKTEHIEVVLESFGAILLECSIQKNVNFLKQQFLTRHRKQFPSVILRVKLAPSSLCYINDF